MLASWTAILLSGTARDFDDPRSEKRQAVRRCFRQSHSCTAQPSAHRLQKAEYSATLPTLTVVVVRMHNTHED